MPERTFTEREIAAILERAAKRQEAAHAAAAHGGGLTLEELEGVAAAAGIDPAHVHAAVAEAASAPAQAQTFAGAPVVVDRVRHLAGPVSDEAWARIVGELRRAFNEDGMAGQVGRVREWSALGRGARRDLTTRLALEPEGTGTRVSLRQSTRDLAFGFTLAGGLNALLAVVFATLAAFGVDSELWIPAGIMTAMALVFLTGVHGGLRIWARRQERKFESVLDRIELIVRDDAGQTSAARSAAGRTTPPERTATPMSPAAEREGRLSPDLLEDGPGPAGSEGNARSGTEPEERGEAARRRTRS